MTDSKMRSAAILVVEDDRIVSQLIQDLFGEEVFAIQTAATAFEALKMVHCSRPDLIILDAGLPDGDGMELCAQWRSDAATRNIPILFLTARSTDEDHVRGLLVGGNDFMTKPFHPVELLERAQALVARAVAA